MQANQSWLALYTKNDSDRNLLHRHRLMLWDATPWLEEKHMYHHTDECTRICYATICFDPIVRLDIRMRSLGFRRERASQGLFCFGFG